MSTDEYSKCEFEQQRYRQTALFRALYTWLVFAFTVVLTGILILALVFIWHKKWFEGAVTGTTSIVGGGGIKFLLDRRAEAVTEEKEQAQRVRDACDPASIAATEAFAQRMKLWGMWR
jgi:hypothetical protein